MDNRQFELQFEDLVSKMRRTLLKKGNDYAKSDDRLDNFKNAGAICGIRPEVTCLNLIAIKVNRMANLINSGTKPENESVQDTALDLACYSVLLNAIINEATPIGLPHTAAQ